MTTSTITSFELNAEWESLGALSSSSYTVTSWRSDCPVFAGSDHLDDVILAIAHDRSEAGLTYLLTAHQQGDPLAGRTVLQAMLPAMVSRSASWGADRWRAMQEIVTQMWIRIATYPLTNRPRHIAANLILDAVKWARKELTATTPEVCVDPVDNNTAGAWAGCSQLELCLHHAGSDVHDSPFATRPGQVIGDVLAAARDLGYISDRACELMLAVYGPEEMTSAAAAEAFGTSPEAVRTQASHAVRTQLIPHATELRAVLAYDLSDALAA